MAGDVPRRSGKGQYGKREKYDGALLVTRLPAMPYPTSKRQEKGSGQPMMNRSKQGRMARKTIFVLWLTALALVPFHLAQAQQRQR